MLKSPLVEERKGKQTISQITQKILRESITPGDTGFPVPERVTISCADLCQTCHGFGWLRGDYPIGDQNFGKMVPCPTCKEPLIEQTKRSVIYQMTSLSNLEKCTFENFEISRPRYTPEQNASLRNALAVCRNYAAMGRGWLVIAGSYGSGKTHLAAAIANEVRIPTLFSTVPELLDQLRAGYDKADEYGYQTRLEQVISIPLLIMDDFGSENSTSWSDEKIFQIVNARYVRSSPTVFTTNVSPDDLDGRIASRMSDQYLSTRLVIKAPDYRKK